MKITLELLTQIGLWDAEEMAVFAGEWPSGANVTRKNVLRALDLGLDLESLASELANQNYIPWAYVPATHVIWNEFWLARNAVGKPGGLTVRQWNAGIHERMNRVDRKLALLFWRTVLEMERGKK